jgi:uncharacterized protein YndB with AHSA1/START domain
VSTTDLDPIVSEVHIDAPPEVVFAFIVEPDKLSEWLCESATLDPRPGGVNHQVHRPSEDGPAVLMEGEFVEVVPYERVSFTWGYAEPGWVPGPGETNVEITLTPTEHGTQVRLEHRGLSGDALANHRKGWAELFGQRLPAAVARSLEEGS